MCDRLWVCAPARNLNDGSISSKAKSTHLFWYTVSRICSNSSLVKEEVLSNSSVNSKSQLTPEQRTCMTSSSRRARMPPARLQTEEDGHIPSGGFLG